jgi:hypothetical protein
MSKSYAQHLFESGYQPEIRGYNLKKPKFTGRAKMFFLVAIVSFLLFSCDNSCKKHIDFKFKKGDLVQVKSSRWAKKGTVIDREVSEDCEAIYTVSQTTWIEGRRLREFYEYELEEAGSGIDVDAKDVLELIKK